MLVKLYNNNPSLNDSYISSALGDCWQYKSMDDRDVYENLVQQEQEHGVIVKMIMMIEGGDGIVMFLNTM